MSSKLKVELIQDSRQISVRFTRMDNNLKAAKYDIKSWQASNGFDFVSGCGVFIHTNTVGMPGGLEPWVPSAWADFTFPSIYHAEKFISDLSDALDEYGEYLDCNFCLCR